jgi:hypothetical protein
MFGHICTVYFDRESREPAREFPLFPIAKRFAEKRIRKGYAFSYVIERSVREREKNRGVKDM